MFFQNFHKVNRFGEVPTAFDPIGRRDSHTQLNIRRCLFHCIKNSQRETNSVFKRTAVLIRSMIGNRRQELVQQIAVSHMHFNSVHTCLLSTTCRISKSLNHGFNAARQHFTRHHAAFAKGNCRRSHRFPTAFFFR